MAGLVVAAVLGREEALVVALGDAAARVDEVEAVGRLAAGLLVGRAEDRPDAKLGGQVEDAPGFLRQHVPGIVLERGKVGAGVARQRGLGEVDDLGAAPGGDPHLAADEAGVPPDVGADGELAGRNLQNAGRRHEGASSIAGHPHPIGPIGPMGHIGPMGPIRPIRPIAPAGSALIPPAQAPLGPVRVPAPARAQGRASEPARAWERARELSARVPGPVRASGPARGPVRERAPGRAPAAGPGGPAAAGEWAGQGPARERGRERDPARARVR